MLGYFKKLFLNNTAYDTTSGYIIIYLQVKPIKAEFFNILG